MHKLIYHDEHEIEYESPFERAINSVVEEQEVQIICPYIGLKIFKRIVEKTNYWQLITDIEEWMLSYPSKERENILLFIESNREKIRHCNSIHAKTIISSGKALLGSANFTESGLFKRRELSILIEDVLAVEELKNWFQSIWHQSELPSSEEMRYPFSPPHFA